MYFAEVFSVPTKTFLHHETTVWLPWFIKRYLLFQKIPPPPQIIETADNKMKAEYDDMEYAGNETKF